MTGPLILFHLLFPFKGRLSIMLITSAIYKSAWSASENKFSFLFAALARGQRRCLLRRCKGHAQKGFCFRSFKHLGMETRPAKRFIPFSAFQTGRCHFVLAERESKFRFQSRRTVTKNEVKSEKERSIGPGRLKGLHSPAALTSFARLLACLRNERDSHFYPLTSRKRSVTF